LLLVDVGFQLIELIDPIAGIVVLQCAFDGRVVDVHHRHLAVPRLRGGGSLADLLEGATTLFLVRTVLRSFEPICWYRPRAADRPRRRSPPQERPSRDSEAL
jgi:hypothetical protein